uniref:Uncharacterized protein n=1 Tax=Arundo donax TaxID=35708 RepID=A0A0A8XYX3_ARUDO
MESMVSNLDMLLVIWLICSPRLHWKDAFPESWENGYLFELVVAIHGWWMGYKAYDTRCYGLSRGR